MAGASQYPGILDTDTQLLRVAGSDAMTIADHNNLVDAIESIEPTLGAIDSTLAGRVSSVYAAPVVDQLGLMSVAGRNPRHPYGVGAAGDLYTVAGVLPAGWSAFNTPVLDWATDAPSLRIATNGVAQEQGISKAIIAGPTNGAVWRLRNPGQLSAGGTVCGFWATGLGDGFIWIRDNPGTYSILNAGTRVAGPFSVAQVSYVSQWVYVQIYYDGSHYHTGISLDGILWDVITAPIASTQRGLMVCSLDASGAAGEYTWFDMCVQGTVAIGGI